ncbi:CBS domain-containing protein [Mycolicibacterium sp. XJ870]
MHAADVTESLPTVLPSDDILAAIQVVTQHHLPGLVVADELGEVVGCMSSVDLLRLTLPRYVQEGPGLARVLDERHADRIAAALTGIRVGDVIGAGSARIPIVRPQATVIELAELMAERGCPLAVVARERGGTLGVVSANHLLELLMEAIEGTT